MENQQYLKILKSQLRSMDHKTRQNILNEIRATLDDAPNEKLEDRFGSVYQLAANYLEGVEVKPTWWSRLGKGVKFLLLGIGALAVGIMIFIYGFSFFTDTEDEFDYQNPTAEDLSGIDWLTVSTNIDAVSLFQTKTIIYTGDFDAVSYSCRTKDKDGGIEVKPYGGINTLEIDRSFCYLRLPSDLRDVTVAQAEIVLTDLQNDLNIDLDQAALRIAFNESVTLVSNIEKCIFEAQKSLNGGQFTLTLSGSMCNVSKYEFNG